MIFPHAGGKRVMVTSTSTGAAFCHLISRRSGGNKTF